MPLNYYSPGIISAMQFTEHSHSKKRHIQESTWPPPAVSGSDLIPIPIPVLSTEYQY